MNPLTKPVPGTGQALLEHLLTHHRCWVSLLQGRSLTDLEEEHRRQHQDPEKINVVHSH